MAWPKPTQSRARINKAGQLLVEALFDSVRHADDESIKAWDDINTWRSCHGYPVNTFQATLRVKLKSVDPTAIVAQRLKRMPSILMKLNRYRTMNLSRMQDIGGLRAVVSSLDQVRQLESAFKKSNFKHKLIDLKDYIHSPKDSGYRSVHLVYKYANSRAPEYNGLCLELQIRNKMQHAWATAVETAGTFLEHALKSNEGPQEWLQFFAFAGSALAHLEGTTPLTAYNNYTDLETFRIVTEEAERLRVAHKLHAYTVAAEKVRVERKGASYYLIILDLDQSEVNVKSYSRHSLDAATEDYGKVEKDIQGKANKHAVLVSAGPLDQLRAAYPNYFLDTHEFMEILGRIKAKI